LERYSEALAIITTIARKIVIQISSVRETFDFLLHNKTQANFVKILRPILESLSGDMEIVVSIINEYAGVRSKFTIRVYPAFIYSGLDFFNKKLFFSFFTFFTDERTNSDKYVDTGVRVRSNTGFISGKDTNKAYDMNNIENRLLSSRYHEMDINEESEGT
jgi:hypothetical protein